jgi:1,2-phenylacetyl-CoA epoxidase catalytic subunit
MNGTVVKIKKWDIGQLNKKEVKEEFMKEETANVQYTQLEVEDMMKYGTQI